MTTGSAPADDAPLVSFVVVNWKNEEATKACVASIAAQDAGVRIEIIVVDNESDGRRARYGQDVLVVNPTNRGFAGGFDDGLRRVRGVFVAAVNNDCQLATEWLRHGLAVLDDPRVGIVGGQELLWNADHHVGDTTSPSRTYVTVDPSLGATWLRGEPADCVLEVASLNGSNLLARRSLLDELGGFAEEFFTYYEDADLCARALALGAELRFCPNMVIWHRGGLSSDRHPFKRDYLSRRNQLLFVARHFPEQRWRSIVARSLWEYLITGLTGSSGGWRGARQRHALLSATQRYACIAVVIWAIASWQTLERSRKRVVLGGQHDESFAVNVAALTPKLGA